MKILEDIVIENNKKIRIIPAGTVIKEQPATITRPKPSTIPKPGIQPGKTPKRDPFNPPKPQHNPKPKAKKKLTEAYEDEAHPDVKNFWSGLRKSQHILAKHPVYAMHGERLSKGGYTDVDVDVRPLMQLVQKIMRIEHAHKDELESLAKEVVVSIWGIDENMLDAKLTTNVKEDEETDDDPNDKIELGEIDDELRKQINKRITMNTLTHGSSIHQMKSAHHLIDKRLKEIDPELINYYTHISKGAHKFYWLIPNGTIGGQSGNVSIKWDKKPIVKARAWIFPVLVQELSKGVMELLTMHGYSSLDSDTQYKVREHADKLEDEQWLIQVGSELWRQFLKVVPKGINLAELIAEFSTKDPDYVHDVIDAAIDDPSKASKLLSDMMKEEPEESKEDDESEEDLSKWKI